MHICVLGLVFLFGLVLLEKIVQEDDQIEVKSRRSVSRKETKGVKSTWLVDEEKDLECKEGRWTTAMVL